ncbi:MAG TPA: prepilin-type N-terminal cleavage/methylation domain-containing protein [Solirubrobacterales bacterium]
MRAMRDERGFTIVELLVSMSATLVVMMGVVTLTTTVIHHQSRISNRVDADSRTRPAMTRIVQGLHSSCVTSHIVPIQTGSTGTSISFLSKSSAAVGPTPDLHTVSLSGTTLREAVYPATGGTPPTWTFSGTPSSNMSLLTNVAAPGGVIFRYYDFVNGALSTTPLPTPLSDSNAARVSYLTVSFTSSPGRGISTQDPNSPVMVTSGVDLRLENAGQYPNQDNLPCI